LISEDALVRRLNGNSDSLKKKAGNLSLIAAGAPFPGVPQLQTRKRMQTDQHALHSIPMIRSRWKFRLNKGAGLNASLA
jgi:hypothetical protein